jgi:type II secretory pathway pseudopilin PulG
MSQSGRGYSLVEAVIVLGIVGVVVGALWSAYFDTRLSKAATDTETLLLQAVEAVRGSVDRNQLTGVCTDYLPVLATKKIFPEGDYDSVNSWVTLPIISTSTANWTSNNQSYFQTCVANDKMSFTLMVYNEAVCQRLIKTLGPDFVAQAANPASAAAWADQSALSAACVTATLPDAELRW